MALAIAARAPHCLRLWQRSAGSGHADGTHSSRGGCLRCLGLGWRTRSSTLPAGRVWLAHGRLGSLVVLLNPARAGPPRQGPVGAGAGSSLPRAGPGLRVNARRWRCSTCCCCVGGACCSAWAGGQSAMLRPLRPSSGGLPPARRCRLLRAGAVAGVAALLRWLCSGVGLRLGVTQVGGGRALALACLLRLLRHLCGRLRGPQVWGRRPRPLQAGVLGRRRRRWLVITIGRLLGLPDGRLLEIWLHSCRRLALPARWPNGGLWQAKAGRGADRRAKARRGSGHRRRVGLLKPLVLQLQQVGGFCAGRGEVALREEAANCRAGVGTNPHAGGGVWAEMMPSQHRKSRR